MLRRRGTSHRAAPERLAILQQEAMNRCLHALRQHPRIELLKVPYPELIAAASLE